jgi:hypothetical protein
MMSFEDPFFFLDAIFKFRDPNTTRKLVWGLLIHDVLGSNFGARRFLKN